MSDKSAPALPAPLTVEQLGVSVAALGKQLKAAGCNDLSKRIAEQAVDARKGGRMQNILNAIPNLAAKPGEASVGMFIQAADRDDKADKDGKKGVDTHEGMALLMAGVNRAVNAGIKDGDAMLEYMKAIKPDEQFFKEVDAMCKQIQATSCSVPKGNPLDAFKPKGRGK